MDDTGLMVYQHIYNSYQTYMGSDDSELNITGALTLGCWVYFNQWSSGLDMGIMGKWYSNGNQTSYLLYKAANDFFNFIICSPNLIFTVAADSLAETVDRFAVNKWFFVVGRFIPSTEVALFVNGKWYKSTNGIPASLNPSIEHFEIGRYNRTNYLDGRVSQAFVCAYAIPDVFIDALYSHTRAMFSKL